MELQYNSHVARVIGKSKAFPVGRRFSRDDIGKSFTIDDKAGRALKKLKCFDEVKPKRKSETKQDFGGLE